MYEDPVRIVEELRGIQKPISSKSQKGKNTPHVDDHFMPRTIPEAQPNLKSVLQNMQIVEKCDKAIAKWMIDALVPFNVVSSAYYQPMIDAISSISLGYKAPNFYRIRDPLLNMWVDDVRNLIESYKEVWKETGCTLMANGWTDRSRRTLINFLIYCLKGTVFLRLLEKEFPKLYLSSCVAHCINLMLQDFGKFEEVCEIVLHASKITKYIYNYCYALFLMRHHTGRRDILHPAPTQFATNFIALQIILAQKNALMAMVTSKDWIGSTYAKYSKAKKFVEQILDSGFWKQCANIVKLTKSLVIHKAREEMVRRFQRNKRKVKSYLEVLDRPCRFNAEEFEKHRNTQSSILKLIDRYTLGDLELQDKLNEDMRIYKNFEGDFTRRVAIRERNTVMPNQWNRLEHQKLNDLVYVRYNLRIQQRNRLRQQNYDPINLETLDDHSNWMLEESPLFLTHEEVEALRNDLANMFIQSTLDDIDELNLDEDRMMMCYNHETTS
ncbi:hypothetical protein GYH30_002788 [Glycine max]|nr:hypothetical protein GYH30_002788 [Glycine max]